MGSPLDGDALCIVCNWYGGLGLALGLGGLGVAAAAAAAAGALGGLGGGGFSGSGADGTWPEPEQYGPRDPRNSVSYREGAYRYEDAAGHPYWPGISPIPGDGVVFVREGLAPDIPESTPDGLLYRKDRPLPVGPNGIPIRPTTGIGNVKVAGAQTASGRG